MALTIQQLIEKLQKVEDKSKEVFFECPAEFYSIDVAYLDEDKDVILYNKMFSSVCDCENCKEAKTEL